MQSNNDDGYDDGCIGSDNNSCVPSGHHHDGDHLVTVSASLGLFVIIKIIIKIIITIIIIIMRMM